MIKEEVRESPILDSLRKRYRVLILQTQVLKVRQVNKSCIGLTQENSMENSVQDSLPYILNPHGPC